MIDTVVPWPILGKAPKDLHRRLAVQKHVKETMKEEDRRHCKLQDLEERYQEKSEKQRLKVLITKIRGCHSGPSFFLSHPLRWQIARLAKFLPQKPAGCLQIYNL